MPVEVEAKFKVANFRAIRRRLRALGAGYCGTAIQLDRFFDTPDRELYRGDRGLRLREVRMVKSAPGCRKGGVLLTYKGPRQARAAVKSRQEIETHVEDSQALAEILRAAGLKVFLKLQKRRASYKLGRCRIELDELPLLGCFVEIEGASGRAIELAAARLGLDSEPIADSYAHLAVARCKKPRRSCLEVTFERFGRQLR